MFSFKKAFNTISIKLSASICLMLFLLMVAWGIFEYRYASNALINEITEDAYLLGTTLRASIEPILYSRGLHDKHTIFFLQRLAENSRSRRVHEIKITDRNGDIIANSDHFTISETREALPISLFNTAIKNRKIAVKNSPELKKLAVVVPLVGWEYFPEKAHKDIAAILSFHIVYSSDSKELFLNVHKQALFFFTSAALVALLIFLLLNFFVLRHTRLLGKLAFRIGKGELSARSGFRRETETGDELQMLGHAFDSMAEKLYANSKAMELQQEELKRVNLELKQAVNQFKIVLDSLDAVVYASDLLTYEIIFINKYAEEIYGNVVGTKFYETIQMNRSGPCSFCSNDKILSPDGTPKETFIWEFQNPQNGKWYQCRDRAIEWIDGKLVRLEIATDITKIKNIEKNLVAAKEEAEEATKLKDKFVSLVAHDLRAPFISITGLLKTIEKDSQNPLHSSHKEIISLVLQSSKNMVQLIEDLLSMSRIKSGTLKINTIFFDCNIIILNSVRKVEQMAVLKGVTIINELPKNMTIFADPNLFGTVVQNILVNAIKFTNKGDSVTFVAPENREYFLAIKDTGIGMNKDLLSKLFNFDHRTSRPGTSDEKGTGFGLPLSMDIMNAHGGTLALESEEGKGTTVYLKLPHIIPKALIVDDEAIFRLDQKLLLETLNIETVEATDSNMAIELLNSLTPAPNLIITDISMPGMDGFELLKQIKADKKTRSIPVIVVTGDPTRELRDKAFEYGASDFIVKPINPDDFLPRVKRFIGLITF